MVGIELVEERIVEDDASSVAPVVPQQARPRPARRYEVSDVIAMLGELRDLNLDDRDLR